MDFKTEIAGYVSPLDKTKVYLAGPITGREDQAAQVFEHNQKLLESKGFNVINPMKLPHNHGKTWKEYMRECIKSLMDCQELVLQDGWQESKGCLTEIGICLEVGIPITLLSHVLDRKP